MVVFISLISFPTQCWMMCNFSTWSKRDSIFWTPLRLDAKRNKSQLHGKIPICSNSFLLKIKFFSLHLFTMLCKPTLRRGPRFQCYQQHVSLLISTIALKFRAVVENMCRNYKFQNTKKGVTVGRNVFSINHSRTKGRTVNCLATMASQYPGPNVILLKQVITDFSVPNSCRTCKRSAFSNQT